jgi:hypothetical protein
MHSFSEQDQVIDGRDASLITRRQAIQRVTALLGGFALVGGGGLLTGCRPDRGATAGDTVEFTPEQIAFLDEVAETILPETSTPGARAAQTGAFMALVVRDVYSLDDQRTFMDGMRTLDRQSERMHNVGFMQASPQQRLALLQHLDGEAREHMDRRAAARRARDAAPTELQSADTAESGAYLPDQRQEGALEGDGASPAAAITADAPTHYFRMMKELALLGYFTSEIGYNRAMRWVESPGRFDPCTPYEAGQPIWAPHA